MNNMKIVFVTSSGFPFYAGGVETWMYNVIKRLSKRHSIIVLASSSKKMPLQFLDIPQNVKIINYHGLADYLFFDKILRGGLGMLNQLSWNYSIKNKLKKIIVDNENSKERLILCCVEPIFTGYVVSRFRQLYNNFSLVISLRGPHLDVAQKSYPLFTKLLSDREEFTVKNCDLVLANGWDTKDNYDRKYNLNCIVQKNGVDIEKIDETSVTLAKEIDETQNSFLSVASLLPIKGVYKLIDAASVYRIKYGTDFMIYFVGKGDQDALKKYAKEKGVKSNIVCLGNKSNPYSYMKKTKINVCLSGGSGLSMSMLEAMATGVPIIALDTPVYQQFNKYNQLELVQDNNPELLADKMNEVLKNYKNYIEMAKKSRLVAEEFDWSIVVADFESNLNRVC